MLVISHNFYVFIRRISIDIALQNVSMSLAEATATTKSLERQFAFILLEFHISMSQKKRNIYNEIEENGNRECVNKCKISMWLHLQNQKNIITNVEQLKKNIRFYAFLFHISYAHKYSHRVANMPQIYVFCHVNLLFV